MFWLFKPTTKRGGSKKSRKNNQRRLRFEGLETRAMLAGNVTVTLAATTLTLVGDASANEIEITAGANPGEYVITGLNNTQINGPSLINDPFDNLVVQLAGGSDIFTVRGISATNRLNVAGDINIDNADGNNTNKLINVQLNDDLTVTKVAGASESNLELNATTIVGDTILSAGGFNGDSKTVITADSRIQGNLTVTNNVGEDHFILHLSTVDGNVTINNGNGDTRTVIGQFEVDPIIFGNLTINNGLGNHKVIIHDTDVWGDVDIVNGDGNQLVSVQNSDFGLGAPVGATGDFEVDNGIGFDVLEMTNATVRDDLDVDNGAGEQFGSTTTLTNVTVGRDLDFDGDGGIDILTMTGGRVVGNADFDLFAGSSKLSFINVVFQDVLDIDGNAGNDELYFERTTVEGDATIDLDGGQDTVELVKGTKLLGSTNLEGGAGIDTLERQVAPGADAVIIAFLANETFELDVFITS